MRTNHGPHRREGAMLRGSGLPGTRRSFLAASGLGAAALLASGLRVPARAALVADPWAQADAIVARIGASEPTLPGRGLPDHRLRWSSPSPATAAECRRTVPTGRPSPTSASPSSPAAGAATRSTCTACRTTRSGRSRSRAARSAAIRALGVAVALHDGPSGPARRGMGRSFRATDIASSTGGFYRPTRPAASGRPGGTRPRAGSRGTRRLSTCPGPRRRRRRGSAGRGRRAPPGRRRSRSRRAWRRGSRTRLAASRAWALPAWPACASIANARRLERRRKSARSGSRSVPTAAMAPEAAKERTIISWTSAGARSDQTAPA